MLVDEYHRFVEGEPVDEYGFLLRETGQMPKKKKPKEKKKKPTCETPPQLPPQTPSKKRILYELQGGRCKYCSEHIDFYQATKDHVIPTSKGGRNGKNIVIACKQCNGEKGDKLLFEEYIPKKYLGD